MVRETSQWEREEMEKVVSETKNSSLFLFLFFLGGWGEIKIKQGKRKNPFSLLHLGKRKLNSLHHIALESKA